MSGIAIDPQTIHRRQEARKAAALVVELIQDVLDDALPDEREIVRGAILEALGAGDQTTPAAPISAMTDQQARQFGRRSMPFGRHKGRRVDEVPLDYLVWLADHAALFVADLRRYCRSPRLQSEMNTSGDE